MLVAIGLIDQAVAALCAAKGLATDGGRIDGELARVRRLRRRQSRAAAHAELTARIGRLAPIAAVSRARGGSAR